MCKFRLKLMVDGTLRGKKTFEQSPVQSCAVSGSWKNNSMDWTYEYKMADGTIHTYSDRYVVQLCSCSMADVCCGSVQYQPERGVYEGLSRYVHSSSCGWGGSGYSGSGDLGVVTDG